MPPASRHEVNPYFNASFAMYVDLTASCSQLLLPSMSVIEDPFMLRCP